MAGTAPTTFTAGQRLGGMQFAAWQDAVPGTEPASGSGPAAGPDGHSGVRIIRISSLVSSGASRSLPGQRPVTRQPSRA